MPRRDVSGEPVKGERTAPGRHVNGYHEAPEEWTRAQTKCNISIEVTSQLKVAWVMQLFHHFDQCHLSLCDPGAESGCRGKFTLEVKDRIDAAPKVEWLEGSTQVTARTCIDLTGTPLDRKLNKNPLHKTEYSLEEIDDRVRWIKEFIATFPEKWLYLKNTKCFNVPLIKRFDPDSRREQVDCQDGANGIEYLEVVWVLESMNVKRKRGDGGGDEDKGGEGGGKGSKGTMLNHGGKKQEDSKKVICRK